MLHSDIPALHHVNVSITQHMGAPYIDEQTDGLTQHNAVDTNLTVEIHSTRAPEGR